MMPLRAPTSSERKQALYRFAKAEVNAASKDLVQHCHGQRNQKEYKSHLHELFRSAIESDTRAISADLLRKLVTLKIGIDPMKDSTAPTPLKIHHGEPNKT